MSVEQTEPRGAAGRRILIVDDDAGQRSLLDAFLRSQGFETVLADSGESALAALRQGRFDMLVSDVRMPGLSGLETLRRARKEHATLPVLLVTAYADIREAVGAMRDGAAGRQGLRHCAVGQRRAGQQQHKKGGRGFESHVHHPHSRSNMLKVKRSSVWS